MRTDGRDARQQTREVWLESDEEERTGEAEIGAAGCFQDVAEEGAARLVRRGVWRWPAK
jgi:hypothetical protein